MFIFINHLVIKTSENNNMKIINESKEIFGLKLLIDNMLEQRLGIHHNKYKLITEQKERNEFFQNINRYIPNFIYSIWNNPKSLATILSVADKDDIKNNLDHFITHYLYENIFSSNGNQDQLIYIITLLLKEEINKLENDIEINLLNFLNGTACGFILEELLQKKEVQSFFKNIIKNVIRNIETIYLLNPIMFNPEEIYTKIIQKKEYVEEQLEKNNKYKEYFRMFDSRYIIPLTKKQLEAICNKYKDTDVKIFLRKKIEKCELYPNLYSIEKIITQIQKSKEPIQIYNYYRQSYVKIIDIIDVLLETLLINSKSLPYFIKCICKIISVFIKKKFPNIDIIEHNSYIANFFFVKLLFLVFKNPALYTLMNENLVIGKTMDILMIVQFILTRFIQGYFFDELDVYVSFNEYFIEKMPKLIEFFNNICQVTLPSFIDKLINDKLPEDYIYNYFEENPKETIFYRQICFNIDILYSLVINADKCKNQIIFDQLVLQKLIANINQLLELKNFTKDNDDFCATRKIVHYFLLSDTINNKKYEKILKIKREKDHFSLKELKKIETEEEKTQNNIIKVKNFLFSFLYNFPTLNKNDFIQCNLNNIINLLKEIKDKSDLNSNIGQTITQMNPLLDSLLQNLPLLEQRNSSNNKLLEDRLSYMVKLLKAIKNDVIKNLPNNSYEKPIPIKWFLGSLIQFLPKLPNEYIENNYEKLLNEIENDINDSIKELDFEFLGDTIEYLREINNNIFYFRNVKNIILDIDLNKEVDIFVEKEQIPMELIFNYNDIQLDIIPVTIGKKKKMLSKNKKIEHNICYTIKNFINNFPDLTQYEDFQDIDLIDLLKEIDFPSKINEYFDIIKGHLKEQKFVNKNNFNNVFNKIYDYILEQLNDKIFPKETSVKDLKISKNCFKLAWVQPTDLINFHKEYILDYYLPDAINYFKKIGEEKSPRKKLICVKEIFNCIYNLGQFNGDQVEGADEELSLLNYTFIKANPGNIYNNCKFMNLFLEEKQKNKIEGNQLAKILLLCDSIEKFTHKDLINITEEEYNEKCKLVYQGLI